ncbi:MAG TPA: sugar nucleotide-binding protein [Chloroflexota bacterium]|nr:sugar nucleotide-binding protein [Chloroflexota bacterium]
MASLLVLGASGLVGSRLVELWRKRVELDAPTHDQLDVVDEAALTAFFSQTRPEVVVNLAAWADVDAAEAQRDDVHGRVYQLNAEYPGRLAELCRERKAHLVHVSTDYVFDGANDQRPYREEDPTNPLSWYARTKAVGEQLITDSGVAACVGRIEMPFRAQPHRKTDFARTCVARLRGSETLTAVADQRITPVFLDDALEALRRLIDLRVTGTVHVASADWTTPYDFARAIAARLGLDASLVRETAFVEFASKRPARRPRHSWLDITRANSLIGNGVLRSVDEQVDVWAAQAREALNTSDLVR